MSRFMLTDRGDARNFRRGQRLVWGSGEESGLAVVSEVDVQSGVVTLRDPTRLERMVHWLTRPWRWLRWRWDKWRHGLR